MNPIDVFLSFRGKDTRKTFVSHLDKALRTRGIMYFKDDRKLEVGDSLPEKLYGAIHMSKFAVVVISENYTTSSWCLEELRQIMELHGKKEIEVIPIFYEVNPSDVRHQRGKFALEKHQGAEKAEKFPLWREALKSIANLKGLESTEIDDDAAMIENVIQRISSWLLAMSTITSDDFVGMEAHMEGLMPLLDMDSKDDISHISKDDITYIIRIFGMTALAKPSYPNTL